MQSDNELGALPVELKPCRTCGAECSVQEFPAGDHLPIGATIWMCSQCVPLKGKCRADGHWTAEAWNAANTRPPSHSGEGDVERVAIAIFTNDAKYDRPFWNQCSEGLKEAFRSDARAALAALSRPTSPDVVWQPIETAAQDGDDILLCCGETGTIIVAYWDDEAKDDWWWGTLDGQHYHKDWGAWWMPLSALPTPPIEQEKPDAV